MQGINFPSPPTAEGPAASAAWPGSPPSGCGETGHSLFSSLWQEALLGKGDTRAWGTEAQGGTSGHCTGWSMAGPGPPTARLVPSSCTPRAREVLPERGDPSSGVRGRLDPVVSTWFLGAGGAVYSASFAAGHALRLLGDLGGLGTVGGAPLS